MVTCSGNCRVDGPLTSFGQTSAQLLILSGNMDFVEGFEFLVLFVLWVGGTHLLWEPWREVASTWFYPFDVLMLNALDSGIIAVADKAVSPGSFHPFGLVAFTSSGSCRGGLFSK